jgi:hypothetical protein
LIKERIADSVTMIASLECIRKFRVTHAACDLLLRALLPGWVRRQGGLRLLGNPSGFRSGPRDHESRCGYNYREKDSNGSALE